MKLGNTRYVVKRTDWRSWLRNHYDKENEIWLVYYRKSSGKPRIPYNDAVEEALCYGWIDSIQKGIDGERYAQRFTPRNPGSKLSEMNKERIHRLVKEKRMTVAGLKAVSKQFDGPTGKDATLAIAADVLKALKADKRAWMHFQNLPDGYKRVRIGYIESRRRHGDGPFQKSLRHFIEMTAKNKKFGMVQ
jgi:uncharacterized protein YdeI (YjbR/CyaY-like superfamily)